MEKKMNIPEEFIQELENQISQLKNLNIKQTQKLAQQIREYLITVIKDNGGHLSSNLGMVDLTLSLYQNFQFPKDSLIFDVSHQSYVHKILSDRLRKFPTIRTKGGLSGFTEYKESPYDINHVAHAGTSISTGLGVYKSKAYMKDNSFTIVVVGDAAIANGVSFEALNHIDALGVQRFMIILNDNQMSISQAVGSFSKLLTGIISHPYYNRSRKRLKKILGRFGKAPNRFIGSMLVRIKSLIFNNYFENFGVRYIGPIDGHNIAEMNSLFHNIIHKKSKIDKPLFIHVITKKGKGDTESEASPEITHGVSPKPNTIIKTSYPGYSQVLEKTLPLLKEKYKNITATTAAMTKGTGLQSFADKYPESFFDVGIAESHGVAFSSFLNFKKAYKPYIAIYSTFFQRALDQVFQDVCLQDLNPVFILDRAGLVGEDGATHHGLYDITYLKAFPRLILCSPAFKEEMEEFLDWAYHQNKPVVIRIPKAPAIPVLGELPAIQQGKGYWLERYNDAKATIIVYGPILHELLEVKDNLPKLNIINMRFAKPLDTEIIIEAVNLGLPIFTLEEHSIIGGIGESIASFIASLEKTVPVYKMGVPDEFIQHATRDEQLEEVCLKGKSLENNIISKLL